MSTETGSRDAKSSHDPIHIGEQCSFATCGTLDFLPITCSFCNSVFCKIHHTPPSHSCSKVPEKLADHVSSSPASKPCHICQHIDIVNVICEGCSSMCCMAHRTLEQHSCLSILSDQSAPKPSLPSLPSSQIKGVTPKRKGAKSLALERKVMLMKMKNKSGGPSSVPVSERLFINVTRATTKDPCYFHFSKSWLVGRCIDVVAGYLKMRNNNDKVGHEVLTMSCNGTDLPMSELLSEFTESGDTVMIYYKPP